MPQDPSTTAPITRRRPHAGGFTLLEAVFTMLVLGLGVTASIATLTHAMKITQANQTALLAATVVSRAMEGELNKTFEALDSWGPLPVEGDDLPGAQVQVTVENYNGDPDLKRVAVMVTLDPARVWRLVTLVAR